jgi:hypothetical protein
LNREADAVAHALGSLPLNYAKLTPAGHTVGHTL